MALVDLLIQWFKDNSQVEFANSAGVTESAVSRWKNGKVDPTFENCLRIAKALNADPIDVFKAADRENYIDLFKHFLPDYKVSPASNQVKIGYCKSKNTQTRKRHEKLHGKLEDILEAGQGHERGITYNLDSIHAYVSGLTSSKEKHPSVMDGSRAGETGYFIDDKKLEKIVRGQLSDKSSGAGDKKRKSNKPMSA